MRSPFPVPPTHSDVDLVGDYLRDIGTYPLLGHDAELALAQQAAAGDTDSLEQLVCANLRFVVSVAKKHQKQGVSLADLISEGNLGLVCAAERFDGAKGVRFISYAVWYVRRAMLQAIAEHGRPVRVPLGRLGSFHRIRRRINTMRQELNRDPTQHEVAEAMHISEDEVAMSIGASCGSMSLDEGQTTSLLDSLITEPGTDSDDEAMDSARSHSVDDALATLGQRDAKLLRLYFGFGGSDPMTLEDIGLEFGITRERVRQIKERALSRLRRSADSAFLAAVAP